MASRVELVGKKNAVSPIWKYFGFIPDRDNKPKDIDEAMCKTCYNSGKKTKPTACKGGNTCLLIYAYIIHCYTKK